MSQSIFTPRPIFMWTYNHTSVDDMVGFFRIPLLNVLEFLERFPFCKMCSNFLAFLYKLLIINYGDWWILLAFFFFLHNLYTCQHPRIQDITNKATITLQWNNLSIIDLYYGVKIKCAIARLNIRSGTHENIFTPFGTKTLIQNLKWLPRGNHFFFFYQLGCLWGPLGFWATL